MSGTLIGLAHIGIKVKDTAVSTKFYTMLGFEQTHQQMNGTTCLTFMQAGSCILELIQPAQYEQRTPGQIDHFAIEVKGIEQIVEKLKANNVTLLSPAAQTMPQLLDGVKNIFFLGPDEERIELFEYYNR